MTVFIIASLGCIFAPTVEVLIAFRFIQGIGAGAAVSVPRAVVRDLYTGHQATRLMSTMLLMVSLAPMLAPLLGSFLIIPFGWRAIFVAIIVAALLSMLATRFAMPETRPPEKRIPFSLASIRGAFGVLIRDPMFLGVSLMGSSGMASFFIFLSTSSFLYIEFYGLTPTQYSFFVALNALGLIAASQIAANLGARFGAVAVVFWSSTCFAVNGLVLLALFALHLGSFPILVAMICLGNVFLGLILPTSVVLALENHGPIAGTAAALSGSLQNVIAAFAMAASSITFDGTPISLVAAIAVCGILSFSFAFATLRKRLTTSA